MHVEMGSQSPVKRILGETLLFVSAELTFSTSPTRRQVMNEHAKRS